MLLAATYVVIDSKSIQTSLTHIISIAGTYPASTVYMVVYLLFIPITHALVSLLVFGWPTNYVTSLMSNVPIGLSGMALGTALTSYLDKISFNEKVEDFIREHIPEWEDSATDEDEKGELYSSILVLIVTSVWGYTLSVAVNSKKPEEAKEKKEL